MSDKPWNELTKEDIGLRPVREDERTTTDVLDWRGLPTGEVGPERPRRCSQSINSGRATYSCGKDAKWVADKGRWGKRQFFCPQHAAGALRSAKHDAKSNEERAAREQGEDGARERLAIVADELGLEHPHLDFSYVRRAYSTTHAVVAIADLERLARQHSDCVPMEQA
jgi:hypothetical protein